MTKIFAQSDGSTDLAFFSTGISKFDFPKLLRKRHFRPTFSRILLIRKKMAVDAVSIELLSAIDSL